MKQLTLPEFWGLFDPEVHQAIIESVRRYPDSEAVVVFQNVELSPVGRLNTKALVVGPSNTFTSVEFCEGKWLGDMPSQRVYPVSFIPADEIRSVTA